MQQQDTIAAISTPLGAGGIGIVRISGPEAVSLAGRLFRSRSGRTLESCAGYQGMLGRVFDREGDLDDCIAFVYRAPKSYTGEQVVELSCHGGVYAVQRVLRLCLEQGARPAQPGEFTRRAFLNGKLGLSEAEAVMDLIGAQGDAAMRAALSARDGALSKSIQIMVDGLLEQSGHLAAWADYPEEEIEAVESETLSAALRTVLAGMDRLLDSWDRGKLLREGVITAIVGRPNVGKSTLMNLLSGTRRSIVTELPGTTRDVVEDLVRLGDCVLHLRDTAGIRNTDDPVERIGVDLAREQIGQADLILAVFDSSDRLNDADRDLLRLLRDKPCVAVINKIDLPQRLDLSEIQGCIPRLVTLSAQTGEGREVLEQMVGELLGMDTFDPTAAVVANQRQRQHLTKAREALREALQQLELGMTLDAVNVGIDFALDELLSLTGQRASEAVVDQVFARFCVGK